MGPTGFDSDAMLRETSTPITGKQINVDFTPRFRAVA